MQRPRDPIGVSCTALLVPGSTATLLVTVLVAIAVLSLFVAVIGWGAARIGAWALADVGRLQGVHDALEAFLAQWDLGVSVLLPQRFNPAWAVLVFALNFIPCIGPLIAAVGIGYFAAAQFGDMAMVLLAVVGTVAIYFGLGSFIFLGVQISIVTLTALRLSPRTRWLAELPSGSGSDQPGGASG